MTITVSDLFIHLKWKLWNNQQLGHSQWWIGFLNWCLVRLLLCGSSPTVTQAAKSEQSMFYATSYFWTRVILWQRKNGLQYFCLSEFLEFVKNKMRHYLLIKLPTWYSPIGLLMLLAFTYQPYFLKWSICSLSYTVCFSPCFGISL